MNKNGDPKYFRSAVIWTVIAVIAFALLCVAQGPMFGKVCGLILIIFCLSGQWIRYNRSRK